MHTWQMQEAKAQLSELVKRSQNEGPQEITMHGKSIAVVVSRETFDRLSQSTDSLVAFMQRSPLYDMDDVKLERDKSLSRETVL